MPTYKEQEILDKVCKVTPQKQIKYYDFIPFFDFQYEKIIFNCQPSHFSPRSAVHGFTRTSVTSPHCMHFVNPWTYAWSGKCIRLLPRPMYKADCLFVYGLLSRVREHFFFNNCSFTSETIFANKCEGSLLGYKLWRHGQKDYSFWLLVCKKKRYETYFERRRSSSTAWTFTTESSLTRDIIEISLPHVR